MVGEFDDTRTLSRFAKGNGKEDVRFTLQKYRDFTQAVSVWKRQITGMANATETFVRSLEEFQDVVQDGMLQRQYKIKEDGRFMGR